MGCIAQLPCKRPLALQVSAAVDTYFLKWRYYFQEYAPATAATPASHKHLHHWVFLIDADVNDYEEAPGSGIGSIRAHLTARTPCNSHVTACDTHRFAPT